MHTILSQISVQVLIGINLLFFGLTIFGMKYFVNHYSSSEQLSPKDIKDKRSSRNYLISVFLFFVTSLVVLLLKKISEKPIMEIIIGSFAIVAIINVLMYVATYVYYRIKNV